MSLFALPFRECEGSQPLRSLADALQALEESGGLSSGCDIEIRTAALPLPDSQFTGAILVLGPRLTDGTCWVVRMPSAAIFTAMSTVGVRDRYDIALLDGATSDADGNVHLRDGRYVHGVRFESTVMRYDLTHNQHVIVHHCAELLGVRDRCFRAVDEGLLPGEEWFDYSVLPTVRIPSVKRVLFDLRKRLPGVTDNFMMLTLARAGFCFPRSEVR